MTDTWVLRATLFSGSSAMSFIRKFSLSSVVLLTELFQQKSSEYRVSGRCSVQFIETFVDLAHREWCVDRGSVGWLLT
jgi:hypothetical protein